MTAMEPKSLNKFMASEQKKTITVLLLSVSILSFVFSYSPLLYSQKQSIFSSNSFHMLKRALNKNFLFLICNGLLVFLAKTSGFVRSQSGFDLDDMLQKRVVGDDILQMSQYTKEEIFSNKNVISESFEAKEENDVKTEDSEGGREISIFIAEESDIEEDDGNGEETKMSTEELNQKCEDFIKRMKEEIIISETRQQLAIAK